MASVTRVLGGLLAASSSALGLSGCVGAGASPDSPAAAPPAVPICAPLKVAVLADKSQSAPRTRTPQLTLDDLEPLFTLVARCGGELGISVIDDRTQAPFVRVRLEPPPKRAPSRARIELRRRRELAEIERVHQQNVERWKADTAARLKAFAGRVTALLDRPAEAARSPVWDAVARADWFLAEPEAPPTPGARRALVLVSDGIDDVRGRPGLRREPLRTLRSGATVLIVNGGATVGSLAALAPLPFESFDAAVRYLERFAAPNSSDPSGK